MPQFDVDVKAFINIKIEADNETDAREKADNLVSGNFSPTEEQIKQLSRDLGIRFTATGFEVDGTSDVEPVVEGEELPEDDDLTAANDQEISFLDIRVEGSVFAVELEYIDEGQGGDYNPADPNDTPLLRFSTQERVDGEWQDVNSGSYCTQVDARCSPEDAKKVADYLLSELERRAAGMSTKRVCEALSWTSLDTVKKAA